MKIGIDASRAFVKKRTGIEEYAYQVIKKLRGQLDGFDVVLYVRRWNSKGIDFELPKNWSIREIPYVHGWTQVGLAMEMLLEPIDLFFSPAHTTAIIHPEKTMVTVHGLEYEHCPQSYSTYSRWFHRFFIKKSCRWATKVIAVSENTKKDLIEMYKVDSEKIQVVYNGYEQKDIKQQAKKEDAEKYLFYIGRLEQRKNILGIIKSFEILKDKFNYEGKLLLAGGKGYGYENIKAAIQSSKYSKDIKELGFIGDKEKWNYLMGADVFLFPSFCEGFGIPIIEAQSVGTPVITSKMGPLDEVVGNEDLCVDPKDYHQIAQKVNKLIVNQDFRLSAIDKGKDNVQRFSWEKCAKELVREMKDVCK